MQYSRRTGTAPFLLYISAARLLPETCGSSWQQNLPSFILQDTDNICKQETRYMQNPSKNIDGNFSSCKKKLALGIPPAQLEWQAFFRLVLLYRKQECLQPICTRYARCNLNEARSEANNSRRESMWGVALWLVSILG